jgi:flagellar assembly protein FliH
MTLLYKIHKSSQVQFGEAREIKTKVLTDALVPELCLENNAHLSSQQARWKCEQEGLLEQAEKEAEKIIAAAEKEAAEILEKSYMECRKAKDHAIKTGYDEGYEQGLNEGRELGYQEMNELIAEAGELKRSAFDKQDQLCGELEKEMVHLVIQTVRRILQIELQDNQELIFNLIEEGLRKCNYTENLIILVSEMDYDLVHAYQNRIYLMTDGIYEIQVKSDPSMSPGSVIIETASGQVDAGIETQVRQVETAFMELLKSGNE